MRSTLDKKSSSRESPLGATGTSWFNAKDIWMLDVSRPAFGWVNRELL